MNNTHPITTWLLALLTATLLVACDAQVKVDTNTGDTTATDTSADDGDTIGDAGATSNGSGTGRTDDGTNGGSGNNNGDGNGNDNGNTDDNGKPMPTGNIRVSSPQPGDLITGRRFTLRGEARTFENTGNYRLRAADGSTLASGFFTATGEMGTFSPYTTTVELSRAYTGDAVLEVFESSAKDGSEINKVSVPLRISADASTGTMPLAVYFTNSRLNPGATDCSRVFPVTRRPNVKSAVARAALEELLRGPTATERSQNFDTEIPSGTRLRDITINGGTATADFSSALNTAAGSCRVTAIRAQIESTLRQFPTVSRVVIAVDGKSSGVLQP